MPEHLWEEAVSLARQLGVHRVKSALRLNYESLRQRLESAGSVAGPSGTTAGFIELSGAQLLGSAVAAGPVVELLDASGVQLTVRFAPGSAIDVARLVEAFRRPPA
jgi:hypothetical protein